MGLFGWVQVHIYKEYNVGLNLNYIETRRWARIYTYTCNTYVSTPCIYPARLNSATDTQKTKMMQPTKRTLVEQEVSSLNLHFMKFKIYFCELQIIDPKVLANLKGKVDLTKLVAKCGGLPRVVCYRQSPRVIFGAYE